MLPSPEDYPDFDPILLKCIGYLNMGGKEARRGLKDLYTELINSEHRASPLHHQKVSALQSASPLSGSPVKSRPGSPLVAASPVKEAAQLYKEQLLVRKLKGGLSKYGCRSL